MNDVWLLVCPAENPKSAREVSGALVLELEKVAGQLGLRATKDSDRKKFYLGLPGVAEPKAAAKVSDVVYPSGSTAQRSSENNAARYAPGRPDLAPPLVKAEPDLQVSKSFKLSEFRPKDGSYTALRLHPGLVGLLEQIRAAAGCSIHVTSGYRPPDYNRNVGGEVNSYHMDGVAADIYASNLSTSQLHAICERLVGDSGGVGYYPTQGFVHVDVRGYRARWSG